MRTMLVTNHKGGVGKTFISVHLAKCLSEGGNRVLLVDCDGQYDAFKFFARYKKKDDGVLSHEISQFLTLDANKECEPLRSRGYEEENYDFIVIDGDARLADTIQNILKNKIRLVIAPVNFQANAIENLEDLFETLVRLQGIDRPIPMDSAKEKKRLVSTIAFQLLVVPLVADQVKLDALLKRYRVKTKVTVHDNMPRMDKEVKQSLTEGIPLWEISGMSTKDKSTARRYFDELAEMVKKFFEF